MRDLRTCINVPVRSSSCEILFRGISQIFSFSLLQSEHYVYFIFELKNKANKLEKKIPQRFNQACSAAPNK